MEKIYLAVTADEYELPLCAEIDYRELARKFGISPNCLLSTISHGCVGRHRGVRFMRVIIDDEPKRKEKKVVVPKKEKAIRQRKKKENKRMIFCDMEL